MEAEAGTAQVIGPSEMLMVGASIQEESRPQFRRNGEWVEHSKLIEKK
jgi:hypothetical protein